MPISRGFAEEPQSLEHADENLRSVPYTRLKIDSAGRMVIPAEMRAAMMVKPGDTVTAEVTDGEFRIVSRPVLMKRIEAEAKKVKARHPGVSLVDELIADRREEALRDAEEADAWRKEHGLPPLD